MKLFPKVPKIFRIAMETQGCLKNFQLIIIYFQSFSGENASQYMKSQYQFQQLLQLHIGKQQMRKTRKIW